MKNKDSYNGVRTLEVLEGADNYNAWIASQIGVYIKSPALEIGAGTGNISEYFTDLKELVLTDIDSALVKHLRQKFQREKHVKAEVLDIASDFSKVKGQFQTIYSVNVLEHIKDDVKALKNMKRLLMKNGNVIILVPAKKRAYKKLDRHLGHYRRYEKNELAKKMKEAGLRIENIRYFNFLGLLSWFIRDIVEGEHPHLKPSQVKLFDMIVPVLRLIEPKDSLPVGISLIAVGKKL